MDVCHASTLEMEAGDCEFKASPNCMAKSRLKNKQKQNKGQRTSIMLEHLPNTCKSLSSMPRSIEDQIKTRQKGLRRGSPIERSPALHKP